MNISSGYILLNKPLGISSWFALRKLQQHFKKLTGQNVKIGHAGTLDPLAEGLLLCGVNKGTKVLEHVLTADKKYTAEIFLGEFSETDDAEGEKFLHPNPRKTPPQEAEIRKIIQKFSPQEGESVQKILQLPPQYSALKIAGKRACDRVRGGQEVVLKKREIEIFDIKILKYKFPLLKISVHCGSGTYIRSLARDIGDELQIGGYLQYLRRESIGNFLLSDAKKTEKILLSDIKNFFPEMFDMPIWYVDQTTEKRLCNGQRVVFFAAEAKNNIITGAIFSDCEEKKFLGFGQKDGRLLRPRKMM